MTTAITSIGVTDANAKALRAVNKWGLHLADFAALTTSSSFSGFGNGTGYTVSNWISDGVFANLAAVQAVYPIVQAGSDYVDWVLLQSAADFLSYGNLGSTNRKNTARRLHIPAGLFKCNHSLQLGYATVGTLPSNLNGNGYVSVALIGEGQQYDTSGNGMNGTTLDFSSYTNDVGIAINKNVMAEVRCMTVKGGYSYCTSNGAFLTNAAVWDLATFKDPALSSTNWIGGNAVNCGIAVDPYSNSTAAAAYPARILPSYFGGGTSTSAYGPGSDTLVEDVYIQNFVVGYGRPNGDSNGEFIRFNRGQIVGCPIAFSMGHSQNRNVSIRDCNVQYFHTAIANTGGVTSNANLHGCYDNIHASYGYQMFSHDNGGWSGNWKFSNIYGEGIFAIGHFTTRSVEFDNCYFSLYDQGGTALSAKNHITGGPWYVNLRNTFIVSRNGLFIDGTGNEHTKVTLDGTQVDGGAGYNIRETNAVDCYRYFGGVFISGGPRSFNVVAARQGNDFLTGNGTAESTYDTYTHMGQQFVEYGTNFNDALLSQAGADSLIGGHYSYRVPKIQHRQVNLGTMISRSGQEVVFPRYSWGTLKADLGDVFFIGGSGSETTICAVVAISGGNMTLRQMNDFYSASVYTDYATSGNTQLTAGNAYYAKYVCTRVRRNKGLIIGTTTKGSPTITNVKKALFSGNSVDTTYLTMAAGDLFIHQEEDMLAAGGSPVSPLNLVAGVNTGAQTITLTNNVNITNPNYPIVFYVKVFNA